MAVRELRPRLDAPTLPRFSRNAETPNGGWVSAPSPARIDYPKVLLAAMPAPQATLWQGAACLIQTR